MASDPDALQHGVPGTPSVALVDEERNPTPPWYAFFVSLWNRTGGNSGSISTVLDSLSDTIGSILYRGAGGWVGLPPSAEAEVLQMGAEVPEWGFIGGASFGEQSENAFFAGPSVGSGVPSFRTIVTVDLATVAGQFPATSQNDNAAAANVGAYVSSSVAAADAVALTTTVAADITHIALGAGDWDVWGLIALSALATTANAWANTASATDPNAPNGGAYAAFGNQTLATPVGMMRVSLPAPGNVYLSINAAFAGALSAYGFLGARRPR